MNFHRLGSLSMYYVFQYYATIRSLSLVRLLAFMKVVLVAGKLTTRNHARETPLLAGYLNTAVQNENVKREAGQNSWLTPLCLSGDGDSLFCEPLWVTGSEITSFKAFLISSVLPQFQLSAECLSVRNWSALTTLTTISGLSAGSGSSIKIPLCLSFLAH